MGETTKQHLERLKHLQPVVAETEEEPVEVEIDRSGFMDPETARGIPCFDGKHGLPGGAAIKGTRPGPGASSRDLEDEAIELNEHARMIARQRMKQAREQLGKPHRPERA